MTSKMEWKILQVGSAVPLFDTSDYSDDLSLPSAFPLSRVSVSFLSLFASCFSSLFRTAAIISVCLLKSTWGMV